MGDLTDETIQSLTKAELICLIRGIRYRIIERLDHVDILRARYKAASDAADVAFTEWSESAAAQGIARQAVLLTNNALMESCHKVKDAKVLRKLNKAAQQAADEWQGISKKRDRLWDAYQRHSSRSQRLYAALTAAEEKEFRA